jgi:hypothetical protein
LAALAGTVLEEEKTSSVMSLLLAGNDLNPSVGKAEALVTVDRFIVRS